MGQLVTSALEMWLGFILVFSLIEIISGHGRLMEPPARNSMWRFGYGTPINYSDNEVFCGGVGSKYFSKLDNKAGGLGFLFNPVRRSTRVSGFFGLPKT